MAKEEKPLDYQRRIRDTKGVAQRLDLNYLRRPAAILLLRSRLTWLVVALAALGAVPLVVGWGGRSAVTSGPVSRAHGLIANRCEACHAQAFSKVADTSCQKCHDGAAHTTRAHNAPACAQCHAEHRGEGRLSAVADGNCTNCHASLNSHANNITIQAREITAFRPGKHPEFLKAGLLDTRPLKLNHAIHMPAEPRTIRGMKLPMQCTDCHVTDRSSSTGALLPVTFEQNCKSCHARELEFDVHHVLGPKAPPAPHTKDPKTIREYVTAAYQAALAADPGIARRPLTNEVAPQPNAAVWLDRIVKDSEWYLLNRKCGYCHEGDPTVTKAGRIAGRYPEAAPWLPNTQFAHREHRAVTCESCHTGARASTKTADVLVPAMKSCLPCHGQSDAGLDRCSECHLYHDRKLEKDPVRQSTEQLVATGGTR